MAIGLAVLATAVSATAGPIWWIFESTVRALKRWTETRLYCKKKDHEGLYEWIK